MFNEEKQIICVRLTNNMELIGKSTITPKDVSKHATIDMEDAIIAGTVQVEEGKFDIQFYPVSFIAKFDDTPTQYLTLSTTNILYAFEPASNLVMKYKQLLSPIVLPNDGKIIT